MEKETLTVKDLLEDYRDQSDSNQDDLTDNTIAANSEACAALCCHECCACMR